MLVTVCGPNLPARAPATFIVHRAGCADLRRGYLKDSETFDVDAPNRTEVCDAVYPPEDFNCEPGEYLFDFHFAPCCEDLT